MQLLMLTQALCAIILAVSFNADAKPNGLRIVNGREAVPHTFPFVALLNTKVNGGYLRCGGSIITPYHILTAAHCVEPRNENVDVYVGVHSLEELAYRYTSVQKRTVVHTYPHPQFITDDRNQTHNDIALLTLYQPIVFNHFVTNVCLQMTRNFPPDGVTATITGWGRTNGEDNRSASDKLQMLQATVVRGGDGSKMYTETWRQSVCKGDSGGPVTVSCSGKTILAGIVSQVYKFTDPFPPYAEHPCTIGNGYFNDHTRVSYYVGWIMKAIEDSQKMFGIRGSPCFV